MTLIDHTEPEPPACVNSHGPESGPCHPGPERMAAQLYTGAGKRKKRLPDRVEPLCYAHALYERRWTRSLGAIAYAEIESYTPQD